MLSYPSGVETVAQEACGGGNTVGFQVSILAAMMATMMAFLTH
jgi:hypothetical protein